MSLQFQQHIDYRTLFSLATNSNMKNNRNASLKLGSAVNYHTRLVSIPDQYEPNIPLNNSFKVYFGDIILCTRVYEITHVIIVYIHNACVRHPVGLKRAGTV